MQRRVATACLAIVASAAVLGLCPTNQPAAALHDPPFDGQALRTQPVAAHSAEGRDWIVGTWRSTQLAYTDVRGWKGTTQIELVASSPSDLELWLVARNGQRSPADDAWYGFRYKDQLVFGPIGSALLFQYRRAGDALVLDLQTSGARIHAELERVR
jgi:hypothetical protein